MLDDRQCKRFDFSQFVRSLMRRVTSLAFYYGECEMETDFRLLSRQADAVHCLDEHFSYVTGIAGNRRLSGVSGHGGFSGELAGLLPFLVLGQYLQVGKGASFGMGRYEILPGCG
jgi:CRISPR/Cas system endoribonuclease Cas6 (RAMP superfamily)